MKNIKKEKTVKQFSLLFFNFVILFTLIISFMLLKSISPAIWKVQLKSSWQAVLVTFLVIHFFMSFVEFIFHRYVLHTPILFLKYLYKQHTLHHALTHIRKKKINIVENIYPILEEFQYRASFFPFWSLFVFLGIATPFFILIELCFPKIPVFLGGFLGITWSMYLYEILHAIEHKPLKKWLPFLENKKWGSFWKKIYGFHLQHHANNKSNESISGFFGLPIPDLIFGTYKNPKTLFDNGTEVGEKEFQISKPCRFIAWLDNFTDEIVKNRQYKLQK